MNTPEILPVVDADDATAPAVMIAATYKDPKTGALYVHEALKQVAAPWEDEAHIAPINLMERFGDVESWVDYVQAFADDTRPPHLTWSSHGLRALLDYHRNTEDRGRLQWLAEHPFVLSREWQRWTQFASGQAVPQKVAVERLEDWGEDIIDPPATDMASIIRTLKATANAQAETEIRPDGGTKVAFTSEKTIKGGGDMALPAVFRVGIPVLKGHTDDKGAPVKYAVDIRVRASVDNEAHLVLRFSIPNAERVLDLAYADRVEKARHLLGDKLPLLRAAD